MLKDTTKKTITADVYSAENSDATRTVRLSIPNCKWDQGFQREIDTGYYLTGIYHGKKWTVCRYYTAWEGPHHGINYKAFFNKSESDMKAFEEFCTPIAYER